MTSIMYNRYGVTYGMTLAAGKGWWFWSQKLLILGHNFVSVTFDTKHNDGQVPMYSLHRKH